LQRLDAHVETRCRRTIDFRIGVSTTTARLVSTHLSTDHVDSAVDAKLMRSSAALGRENLSSVDSLIVDRDFDVA